MADPKVVEFTLDVRGRTVVVNIEKGRDYPIDPLAWFEDELDANGYADSIWGAMDGDLDFVIAETDEPMREAGFTPLQMEQVRQAFRDFISKEA